MTIFAKLALLPLSLGLLWLTVVMAAELPSPVDQAVGVISSAAAPGSEAGEAAGGREGDRAVQDADEEIARLEPVKQRAVARWGALIDRDFHRAYAFFSPAYRAVFTPKQFAGRFGATKVSWERVEVVSVKLQSDETAIVEIKIFAHAFLSDSDKPVPVSTVYNEDWVRSEGEWWFVPGK